MDTLDYGVIGNCKTAALISREGSMDWLCLPNFDSPSVFTKLLDKEKGGSLSFIVSDKYQVSQKYIPFTNILCTQFLSDEGSFEVLDFMPRYRTTENDHYMPAEIYRYIRLMKGSPVFRIHYEPVMNYTQEAALFKELPHFIKTYSSVNEQDNFYLYSSLDYSSLLKGKEIRLEKDEYLLLSYNQKLIPIDMERVYLEFERTKIYWLNWCNRSRRFKQYDDAISRSLLILKLMSFQESGAVLAALTTSIPETIGEMRNWDYRFCWLRDASMSIDTLINMGHQSAAKRFMGFIKGILKTKTETFQIMYGIHGEKNLEEKILPDLSGFANSKPVRVGNAAYFQKQNDSLGYLMDVMYRYYIHFPGTLDELEEMWEMVKSMVRTVYQDWSAPDQSIWEFRNKVDHFVFSKVMSWVALDRAVKIARCLHKSWQEKEWRKEADRIKKDVLTHGWNEQLQSFTQAYGSEDMDSSLLLMEYYGFIEPKDELFIKTVWKVKEELYHNGLMFRYRNHDDFGLPSSSFTICNFWMIRAMFVIGEEQEALRMLHEVLTYSNHLGLFSEDLDFQTKSQLGNFPQAYSHLALINTAILFSEERKVSQFIRP
ncbi:MAG: glycoside hydrolase family 15 protein [Tannerellaceae bacterium]|nr:glycoside hydrolase family 15 protein [Tannerellaceae bacterium]